MRWTWPLTVLLSAVVAFAQDRQDPPRLGVVVMAYKGDIERAVSSLEQWPTKCSPLTLQNADLILYYAEGEDSASVAALSTVSNTAGRCFSTTRIAYANLAEEDDVYPKGPSIMFYKMFLDEGVRSNFAEYVVLSIVEWDVFVASDDSFEELYHAAFNEDFWVQGSNLEGATFHSSSDMSDMWHMLGHINGNAIYNNNDQAFVEYVDYTLARWGYDFPYYVALWLTLSDFPYSWPLYQRYASKFVVTNLISYVGNEHVTHDTVSDAVDGQTLYIHGKKLHKGSIASYKAVEAAAAAAATSVAVPATKAKRRNKPYVAQEGLMWAIGDEHKTREKRNLGGDEASPTLEARRERIKERRRQRATGRRLQRTTDWTRQSIADMRRIGDRGLQRRNRRRNGQDSSEDSSDDVIYRHLLVNEETSLRRLAHSLDNLKDRNLLRRDDGVFEHRHRLVDDDTSPRRLAAMLELQSNEEQRSNLDGEKDNTVFTPVLPAFSEDGDDMDNTIPFFHEQAERQFFETLKRGNLCAFIAGREGEAAMWEVTVKSVLQFVPGMRVAIAAEAKGLGEYDRLMGHLPGVAISSTRNAATAGLFADVYCGDDTVLILYVQPGSVLSRSFTSKDTHSPQGDLLVEYGGAEGSCHDSELGRLTAVVLGFEAPCFTHGTELMLPVGENKELRAWLELETDADALRAHDAGDETAIAVIKELVDFDEVSAVPQMLAALAYAANSPGMWFFDPQAWVSQHLFKETSIWNIPLVKPRYTCTIAADQLEPGGSRAAGVLQDNLDFFARGGKCANGLIDFTPQH